MCSARVVLPQLSGPYISTMRPRGTPPMPSARSRDSDPVGMASTLTGMSSPRRMMAPLPKFFSICAMAVSSALRLSADAAAGAAAAVFFFSAMV